MSTRKALTDCVFYYDQTKGCSKGDKCGFRHEKSALGATEDCTQFQNNECHKHCNKRHKGKKDQVKVPAQVAPNINKLTDCRDFYSGKGCNKGDNCWYRHEPKAKNTTEVCQQFKVGKCKDVHCRYLHPKDMVPVPQNLIDCSYFYKNENCSRGEKCKNRHEPKAKGVSEVCQKFKEKKCKDVHCGHRHPNDKDLQDCDYYYWGNCKQGDKCFYRHEPNAKNAKEDCELFLRNNCRDPQCNKIHGRKRRVITKNPEEENWSYVCRESDPATKILRKLYLQDVSLTDLLDLEMTCLDADIPIPSSKPGICTWYLEDECKIGCKRYHCQSPYYWQIQYSKSFWINLTEMQNKALERTYCDVTQTQCMLGVLDAKTYTDSHPLFKLLASDTWTANFDEMELTGSSARKIKLRRLSTPSFIDSSSDVATFWTWFYEDEVTKKWTSYSSALYETTNVNISEKLEKAFIKGEAELPVSVAGKKFIVDLKKFRQVNSINSKNIQKLRRRPQQDGIKEVEWSFLDNYDAWFPYGNKNQEGFQCTVTSADIEKAYLQNPSGTMTFKSSNSNASYDYVIDFKQMTQQNQQTNVIRKMNRVEKWRKIKKKISSRQVIQAELPSTWSAEMGGETCKTFPLSDRSSEYNEILQFFNQTAGGAVKRVVKISRVQNTRLYRNFCNKRDDMMKQYDNDAAVVNEQRLFHGTRPDVVAKICKGNFNWRYTGTNVGHVYGRGSYFSNESGTSIGYCDADSSNHKFIFTARVLVGKTILGDGEMVMPPEQSTGVLYDTTVNSVSNPTIFVAYQDDSCYPEYLIEYMA